MQRKGNPGTLLVGMEISTAIMENSMEVPQKTKNRTAASQLLRHQSVSTGVPETHWQASPR